MEEDQSRVQEISVDEAKSIDTTKVAYFTLTDGTLVVVKPKDEINKGSTVIKKKIIETETVETNQGDIKQESPEERRDEEAQEKEIKKEEGEINEEDINTNSNQIKKENQQEEDNQENIENNREQENYENQQYAGQEIVEENYENYGYQNPQQVEYFEDEDEGGGKIMSYGGIIEERRNYRFYASGIQHIPEIQEQQIIEEGGINQENQEYIQEQIEGEEDQRICHCHCHTQTCEHCCGKNGQLYKLVETVPVETVEYVTDGNIYEECPREYGTVRYVVEREPEYVPYRDYIVEEEIIDDNNYNCRCCCHCHCGHRYYYDDYNGEYIEYVDEPRCMCPLGCREYVGGKRYVRYINPK